MILGLIEEALASGARLEPAYRVLGVDPRTVQRWKKQGIGDDRRAGPLTKPRSALCEAEKAALLAVENSPEFRDMSPK